MDFPQKLNGEGTTIIQVTHTDAWTAYGNRFAWGQTAGFWTAWKGQAQHEKEEK